MRHCRERVRPPILVSDPEGNVVYANDTARCLLDQLGVELADGFLPAGHTYMVKKCLEDRESYCRIEVTVNDHFFVWIYKAIASLNVVHHYAIDITEYKWAERKTKALMDEKSLLLRLCRFDIQAGMSKL